MGNIFSWIRRKKEGRERRDKVKSKNKELDVETCFLDLPDDMIEKIFSSHLNFSDRCRMRGVNKRLYGIEERMKKPLETRPNLIISSQWHSSLFDITLGHFSDELCSPTAALLLKRFHSIFHFNKIKVSVTHGKHMRIMPDVCDMNANSIEIPVQSVIILTISFRLFQITDPSIPSPTFDRSIICDMLRDREIVKITRVCPLLSSNDLENIIQTAKVSDNFCGIGIRVAEGTAKEFMKTCNTADEFRIGRHYKVQREEGALTVGMYCDYDEYTFVAYKVPSKFTNVLHEVMASPSEMEERAYRPVCRDLSDVSDSDAFSD